MDWRELWEEYQKTLRESGLEPTSDDLFTVLEVMEKRKEAGFDTNNITQQD